MIARCTADGELISTLKLWQVGFEKQPVPAAIAEQVMNESVTNLSLKGALAINDVGQILVREFIDPLEPPEYFVLTPVSATD